MEFKKYTTPIKVNEQTVDAEITIEVHEDDHGDLLDQDFENEEQRRAYEEKVRSGEVFAGYVVVTARAEGLEGSDSLGCCELKPNNMFNSKPFEQSVEYYVKEHSMVDTAIDELTKALQNEYQHLVDRAAQYKKYSSQN